MPLAASILTVAMAATPPAGPPATPESPPIPESPVQVSDAPAATPTADDPSHELAEKPSELDGLGVSLRLLKDASLERLPGTFSFLINDSRNPPRYFIRVQSMVASAASSSPQIQFEQHLRFMEEKGTEYEVIRDIDLSFSGARAKLAYLAMPAGEGVTAITGWLLIQTGPNTFVVFSVISSGVDFDEIDDLLAASFATINLSRLEEQTATHATKLDRTRQFLASLSPQKLRAAADGRPRWYRLYRPGAGRDGSDLEMGFLRIRAFEGERGEVSTSSTASSRTAPDMGLMVELIAKILVGGDASHIVDAQSRFWQSWDRQAESWSTVSTERIGTNTSTWGQTGWRSRPMSTNEQGSILTVVNSVPSKAVNNEEQLKSRQPVEWEVPEVGYINQAEVILLGALLPRDRSLDGEFAFYWYDSRSNKLPQRSDIWTSEPDGGGRHVLLSRPSADAPEMKQLFGSTGERLRRIDADGLVTELIEHADLMRIWKTKGLPTG